MHLILVSTWLGLVLAELVLEAFAQRGQLIPAVSTLHYWLDALFEVPLLVGILLTGVVLTARLPDLGTLLLAKLVAALVAIGATALVVRLVRERRRALDDMHRVLHLQRQMAFAALVGVPAGLLAGGIGLTYAF